MDLPVRVAIVGSGPSGLYAAAHLLENHDFRFEIDIFEKLPTPWGLVRGGVAPDHPEKKLVIDRQFDFWLKDARVHFFGNVEIGAEIRHADLAMWYNAIIYAVGAEGHAKLGISGEDLLGSWSAREFVAFYNGHPDFASLAFDFGMTRAVVIGNGNVALDIARMLTRDISALAQTDIADHAIEALGRSRIREVVILGRRGPLQAAYSNAELEELEHLRKVDVTIDGADSILNDAALHENADPIVRRKMQTLRRLVSRSVTPGNKRITFRFLRSPVEMLGTSKVEQLVIRSNVLQSDIAGKTVLRGTEEIETIEAGLIFRAVGYRGKAFPDLPFDDRLGVILNDRGRVTDGSETLVGVYTTGWIKRGCTGIIGTNKKCAYETTRHLLDDLSAKKLAGAKLDRRQIKNLLITRVPRAVSLARWVEIDRAERSAGRSTGRPRVKITSWEGLLNIAHAQ